MADSQGGGNSSGHSTNRSRGNSSSHRGSSSFRGKRGRGGRGNNSGDRKGKQRDLPRSEWAKNKPDKRSANDEWQAAKKQKLNNGESAALPVYATQFDAEDIAAEERRPKKKVAVLIGYSGTGYKGMQLAPDQKTIEGDLFKAFVAAGAISKANADDPKKSSFVRCARTDKGVHAAGNIISLKLIVEEEDIVKKINDNLTPQIRVWGFERTNNSFSSYQLCDSRVYEYLIPTHSFLPPHPRSFLGKKCLEWAEKKDDTTAWKQRQEEVEGYWERVDEEKIKPILQSYSEDVRNILEKALWLNAEQEANAQADPEQKPKTKPVAKEAPDTTADVQPPAEDESNPDPSTEADTEASRIAAEKAKEERIARRKLIDEGVKRLRAAYVAAKREYRIPETRKNRIQATLDLFLGTHNFWNFTIQKPYRDPSAKRVIKSFKMNPTPIIIDGTEWLSLKVHGQSFMMHQIRKMIGMVALIIRCGCDPQRLVEAYGPTNFSIPKAPALGLLLERPVFDSYNKRAKSELGKDTIDFEKYQEEMDLFKQNFIYNRMYEDEERDNVFGNFFNHVDNFPANTFLFVTSGGLDASGEADGPETGAKSAESSKQKTKASRDIDSDDEDAVGDNAGNEG